MAISDPIGNQINRSPAMDDLHKVAKYQPNTNIYKISREMKNDKPEDRKTTETAKCCLIQ